MPAAAYATTIWGASDTAPAAGTDRLPVDTGASSSPGYLEVDDLESYINAADVKTFCVKLGAIDGDVAAGTDIDYFRMPYAFTVTAVRASVFTAGTTDTIVVDINEGGSTILTTKLSIDATEKTSTTAATAAVIGGAGPAIADDAEITFDVDSADTGNTGMGLTVCLIGTKT